MSKHTVKEGRHPDCPDWLDHTHKPAPTNKLLTEISNCSDEIERRIENTLKALSFARSVIKSGEPWTSQCEEIIGGAISSLAAELNSGEGKEQTAFEKHLAKIKSGDLTGFWTVDAKPSNRVTQFCLACEHTKHTCGLTMPVDQSLDEAAFAHSSTFPMGSNLQSNTYVSFKAGHSRGEAIGEEKGWRECIEAMLKDFHDTDPEHYIATYLEKEAKRRGIKL